MATYKLIPSSWVYSGTLTNPSNAFTDTDSTTYAELDFGTQYGSAYLGGFDFSIVPSTERITGITAAVKFAPYSSGTTARKATLMSSQSGVALSDTVSSIIAAKKEFSLTADIDTILSYTETLCVMFSVELNSPSSYVYGAEIIVETVPIVPNKIIYGNETLIDLTGDTATASDVASGKTFHLASGVQATGTLSTSPLKATATLESSGSELVFSGLLHEPSWFVALFDGSSVKTSNPSPVFLYDGIEISALTCSSSSGSGTVACSSIPNSSRSFTYSNGVLTLALTTFKFPSGGFTLYYL